MRFKLILIIIMFILLTIVAFAGIQEQLENSVVLKVIQTKTLPDGTKLSRPMFGSGVLTANGYVLTAAHIVKGVNEIYITYYDGKAEISKLLYLDHTFDLGLVEVKRIGNPVVLGPPAQVGDRVFGIGSIYKHIQHYYRSGVVGFLDFKCVWSPDVPYYLAFVTDMYAAPGSSGGAVYHDDKLVGIISGKMECLTFCVPVRNIVLFIDKYKRGEYVD